MNGIPSDGQKTLKDYMTPSQREKLRNLPTWHSICTKKTGVARPGKQLATGLERPTEVKYARCFQLSPAPASIGAGTVHEQLKTLKPTQEFEVNA
jgi:hypothetical protein